MPRIFSITVLALALLGCAGWASAQEEDAPVSDMSADMSDVSSMAGPASGMAEEEKNFLTQNVVIEGEVRLLTDNRNRGVSDNNRRPAVRATLNAAHASGLVGFAEINTISRKVIPGSDWSLTAGVGWRGGDSEKLHYGLGLAREQFVGGQLQNVPLLDASLTPVGAYSAKFNSSFLVLEGGYANLDARLLYTLNKNFRGIDTGIYCGALAGSPQGQAAIAGVMGGAPTAADLAQFGDISNCYGAGYQNSRGSWLLDVNYKIPFNNNNTWLTLHAGYQHVRHFSAYNFADYSLALTHKWAGLEWTAEAMTTQTKNRVLFMNGDYSKQLDNSTLQLSVAKKF